uniref:Nubbin-like protein 4 n=1 Tax=Parasacculina yatsui TaxID=2836420 RepID=A0A8K1VE78_9CRUS|nr:nubbin-like protein 4 [Parasacculina yatsui]
MVLRDNLLMAAGTSADISMFGAQTLQQTDPGRSSFHEIEDSDSVASTVMTSADVSPNAGDMSAMVLDLTPQRRQQDGISLVSDHQGAVEEETASEGEEEAARAAGAAHAALAAIQASHTSLAQHMVLYNQLMAAAAATNQLQSASYQRINSLKSDSTQAMLASLQHQQFLLRRQLQRAVLAGRETPETPESPAAGPSAGSQQKKMAEQSAEPERNDTPPAFYLPPHSFFSSRLLAPGGLPVPPSLPPPVQFSSASSAPHFPLCLSTDKGRSSPQTPARSSISHSEGLSPVHVAPGSTDVPAEENADLEDLELFAKSFKQKRIKLGFTQGDVGLAMGKLYGNDFSQTTISRFEALNLSFKNMCKLKPLLEKWLADADRSVVSNVPTKLIVSHGETDSMCRKRKKRTSIDTTIRVALEKAFLHNQKPTSEEIALLGRSMGMEKEVIRVWFCNRRQKQRRAGGPAESDGIQVSLSHTSPTGVTSSSTDIMHHTELDARLAYEDAKREDSCSPISSGNVSSPRLRSRSPIYFSHSEMGNTAGDGSRASPTGPLCGFQDDVKAEITCGQLESHQARDYSTRVNVFPQLSKLSSQQLPPGGSSFAGSFSRPLQLGAHSQPLW